MTNAVIECILSRTAAKYYDPAATMSDDQIRELVRIGTTAPSFFHLQNWRFIAVRTREAKARLSPIAWKTRDHGCSRYLHRLRPVGRFQCKFAAEVGNDLQFKRVANAVLPPRLHWKLAFVVAMAAFLFGAFIAGLTLLIRTREQNGDMRFRSDRSVGLIRTIWPRPSSAGHAVVRGRGASRELATEAAPTAEHAVRAI